MVECPRAEVEGNHRPEQPPEWFGHVAEPLHPHGEALRIGHCIGKENERAVRHHRPGQAIQPVHEPVEPATGRADKLLAELGEHPVETLMLGGVARGAVAEEDPGLADSLADPAVGGAKAEKPSDHAHPLTRSSCSARVKWKRGSMNSSARMIQPPLPPSLRRANFLSCALRSPSL